jgi:hypothetical protein
MHDRRVLGIAFAVFIAGALSVVVWGSRPGHCPLVLNIASVEPAGIDDDTSEEMWLVNLRISNSDGRSPSPQNRLYVKSSGSANRWIGVEGTMHCALDPGEKCERLLLLPARADACRVCVKYTGASLLFRAELRRIVERMPSWIRFRVSHKFWGWVGFGDYGPSGHWREINVELPFRPKSARPMDLPRAEDNLHGLGNRFAVCFPSGPQWPDSAEFHVRSK